MNGEAFYGYDTLGHIEKFHDQHIGYGTKICGVLFSLDIYNHFSLMHNFAKAPKLSSHAKAHKAIQLKPIAQQSDVATLTRSAGRSLESSQGPHDEKRMDVIVADERNTTFVVIY
ncbi:uncharacterized protein CLUP02_07929 [Colletotrichum lupini]|uniref:Uncharacterized protein n=1 Tax=Colletotrichum lupini TaxID=145971 RepID=A0A9Q8SS11_9PEZI|nr:uncharacterized protein CLUP02_07929 [Colletotrichum lupini]UQC82441.1 hypothetical protein CLUP02_07929 [Colletotrichum lupini]